MERWTVVLGFMCTVVLTQVYSFSPEKMNCCDCKRMMPVGIGADIKPQTLPSPFRIKIAPNALTYNPRLDINVNLTSEVEGRSFVSFMIQARRVNQSLNTNEPLGTFTALGPNPVQAMDHCPGSYGSAFLSTEFSPKTNVALVWNPPTTYQGHVEFRVTFVEDERQFWVKEKSRVIYDPDSKMPPNEPIKYVLPPIPGIDVTQCGKTKGCYRIPEDCVELECLKIFTWREEGSNIVFEMSGLTDGFADRYFAVALSEDIYCGNDLVFECVHNFSSGRTEVFQSLNVPDGHDNVRFEEPKVGISMQEGSYNNGRLRCRFKRAKSVNHAVIGKYNIMAHRRHLLMGTGPSNRGQILRHGLTVGRLPVASPDKVDLLVFDDISGIARYSYVKAHACLMLLAWIFFAPTALIWMKYYTTMWPNSRCLGKRYWFVWHFCCTFWVILLVVISIILIFVEAEGWTKFPDLPQKAHPILGIIVFICVLVIPIIALIRCPENHTCRPVGNWFYWLFWTIAFCLAIPNIFIGMEFGKAMVPWWLTWILCIFFLFNFICEVILEVHQCCTHKKNKERRKKWELQKKENPKVHIPEPWPAGRVFKRNVLFTHFIVSVIVTVIAVITVAVS